MDWELAWRLVTALGWFVTSIFAMWFGSIVQSKRPPAFRLAGILGVAGTFALVMLAYSDADYSVWNDMVRYLAIGFYLFMSFGLCRAGRGAKRLHEFGQELSDGPD